MSLRCGKTECERRGACRRRPGGPRAQPLRPGGSGAYDAAAKAAAAAGGVDRRREESGGWGAPGGGDDRGTGRQHLPHLQRARRALRCWGRGRSRRSRKSLQPLFRMGGLLWAHGHSSGRESTGVGLLLWLARALDPTSLLISLSSTNDTLVHLGSKA